ncbi:MAG: YfbM family protein [Bryobacterales bacterium]|nr:YfbM family protein [Bryobacterales bacterium]
MNGKLRRIPATDVQRLRTDEDFLNAVTGIDDFAGQFPWYLRLLLRLTGTKIPMAENASPKKPVKVQGEILNLHKSWQGLHYLITEHPWEGEPPLSHAVLGDTEIGDDLTGYGPARLNDPEEVRQIANALAALSDAELLRRFEGQRMDELEIYPGGWQSDSSWKDELRGNLTRLRAFYKRAAAAGDATLTWIE